MKTFHKKLFLIVLSHYEWLNKFKEGREAIAEKKIHLTTWAVAEITDLNKERFYMKMSTWISNVWTLVLTFWKTTLVLTFWKTLESFHKQDEANRCIDGGVSHVKRERGRENQNSKHWRLFLRHQRACPC